MRAGEHCRVQRFAEENPMPQVRPRNEYQARHYEWKMSCRKIADSRCRGDSADKGTKRPS